MGKTLKRVIIIVVIGVNGTFPKGLRAVKKLEIRRRVETIQTTASGWG